MICYKILNRPKGCCMLPMLRPHADGPRRRLNPGEFRTRKLYKEVAQ